MRASLVCAFPCRGLGPWKSRWTSACKTRPGRAGLQVPLATRATSGPLAKPWPNLGPFRCPWGGRVRLFLACFTSERPAKDQNDPCQKTAERLAAEHHVFPAFLTCRASTLFRHCLTAWGGLHRGRIIPAFLMRPPSFPAVFNRAGRQVETWPGGHLFGVLPRAGRGAVPAASWAPVPRGHWELRMIH